MVQKICEGSQDKVFLCHSNQDKEIVRKIAMVLKDAGISVWYDEWEISWGDSIVDRLNSGLTSCRYLIVFLSVASVSSNWVKRELNSTLMAQLDEEHIKVLPVKLEDCPIPHVLKDIQWVSLKEQRSYKSGLTKMIKELMHLREVAKESEKINDLILRHFPEAMTKTFKPRVTSISCPNCGGPVRTYSRKSDAPDGFDFFHGIQCTQCGMHFSGSEGHKCKKCGGVMLWTDIGSSEGGYGKYEEDYMWQCSNCNEMSFK